MQGFITIHRKLMDSAVYKDSHAVHLWLHLLLKCNHRDNEVVMSGRLYAVKRGQTLTGRKALSAETGIQESKIERLLKLFEKLRMIEQQTNNRNRLVTVLSYDSYQSGEQQVNNTRTTGEQQVNTNNNDNNGNNDDKSTKADPIPYQDILNLYNQTVNILPKAIKLNPERKRLIKKMWHSSDENGVKSYQDMGFYRDWFAWCDSNPFLTGNNDRGWVANFDFCVNVSKVEKAKEDRYNGN